MSVTVTNIYSGPVTTFKIGGTDIGGTNEGVTVTREDEFADMHCDQIKGPIRKNLVSRKFVVETRLAEVTLANLEKALGQQSGNLVSSSLSLDDDEQGSVTLEILVPCPTGVGNRTIKFDTCYNITGGATEYKKDGTQTVIPVTFDCLPNTSGVHGYIADA